MKNLLLIVIIIISLCAVVIYFFSIRKQNTYVLYRNSSAFGDMQIHIASFNAKEPGEYNRENCEIARDLFQSQPGVKAKYWCDKAK